MDTDELTCLICYDPYDTEFRIPRMIPCGHTICSHCVFNLIHTYRTYFQCPFDKKIFNSPNDDFSALLPTNFALLSLLGKKKQKKVFNCLTHQRKMELFCKDCSYRVCIECAFQGSHQGHKIDLLDSILKEAKNKMNEIEEIIQKIERQHEEIENKKENLLELKKHELNLLIDIKLGKFTEILEGRSKN
jgi:RING-finger-containing E3 ubiquitin ligase